MEYSSLTKNWSLREATAMSMLFGKIKFRNLSTTIASSILFTCFRCFRCFHFYLFLKFLLLVLTDLSLQVVVIGYWPFRKCFLFHSAICFNATRTISQHGAEEKVSPHWSAGILLNSKSHWKTLSSQIFINILNRKLFKQSPRASTSRTKKLLGRGHTYFFVLGLVCQRTTNGFLN